MGWYAAHIIQYARFKDGRQDTYPCYENIVLLDATSISAAQQEAVRIGREQYGPGSAGEFLWEERPADWVFAGVRKLVECVNPNTTAPDLLEPSARPEHGAEIT